MLVTLPLGTGASERAGRSRCRTLFDALLFVTGDLSLPEVQHRIVVAACELVGACDGALAIRNGDGALAHVVAHGAGAELADPDRAGDRPHVTVPVDVRSTRYATLHVAASATDSGGETVATLQQFAAAAGTAVDNAQRYDEARRSGDWLNASGEIARALLADADADTLLDVVSRALYVAEADLGTLILPTADGRMRVAVSVGIGADRWQGRVFDPEHSAAGRAMARGDSMLVPDVMALAAADFVNLERYGPMMLAPLIDAKGIRGAVVLIRLAGRTRFTPHELDLATTFADQVALALELNDMRADGESLRALQDRHRIAQDLHDNVMQRLFAAGMGMQGVAARPDLPADVVERLLRHVADLDETIDEIRDTVFGLRQNLPPAGLRTHARFPRVPAPNRPDGHHPAG